jgi:KUP system potassium uptake protein
MGQIYMPHINAFLFVGVLALVLGFQNSSNMAAAYGIAVTGIMVSTTLLAYLYLRHRRGWGCVPAAAVIAGFLAIDLAFLASTLIKVPEGGWVSLLVAAFVFVIMSTWVREREIAHARSEADAIPLADFAARIAEKQKAAGGNGNGTRRVPGTAVFLSQRSGIVPHALLHNLKHNRVVHEQVILLTVDTAEVPYVPAGERLEVELLGQGFCRIVAHYGFMQDPNVPRALALASSDEFPIDPMKTTYFLGREKLIPAGRSGMARWRERLFALLSQNAEGATGFFRIPPNRVVELGAQIEL